MSFQFASTTLSAQKICSVISTVAITLDSDLRLRKVSVIRILHFDFVVYPADKLSWKVMERTINAKHRECSNTASSRQIAKFYLHI